jgi:hypothetical protein
MWSYYVIQCKHDIMLKGSSSSKQWPSCPKTNAASNNDDSVDSNQSQS